MDKIKTIETGKRYMRIMPDGTAQISKKPQTERPEKLDIETANIVTDFKSGKIDIKTLDSLNGKKVEVYTDQKAYDDRVKSIAEKEQAK